MQLGSGKTLFISYCSFHEPHLQYIFPHKCQYTSTTLHSHIAEDTYLMYGMVCDMADLLGYNYYAGK